jgi:hypothetical protein
VILSVELFFGLAGTVLCSFQREATAHLILMLEEEEEEEEETQEIYLIKEVLVTAQVTKS